MKYYPYLFTPLEVANITLKNRFIMGAMHTGLENEPYKLASFYEQRALGGVGLIITGGVSPNLVGSLYPFASNLICKSQIKNHKIVTDKVHNAGAKIAMQILHGGRYSYHPFCVSPSGLKSPISKFKPFKMSNWYINKTIKDYVKCATLAKLSGYDGVEIMGSEGYLINQFIVTHTNKRTDKWGGSFDNRIRFALDIIKGIRQKLGLDFLIIFRLSVIDLIDKGSTFNEVIRLASELEKCGVNIITTGIGWHEARVPTIATMVPRNNFVYLAQELKKHIKIPIAATNRINNPEDAEDILATNKADLIMAARPFLADPEIVLKSFQNKANLINTCIACNQACLDHVFEGKPVSCLVNPFAMRETELILKKVKVVKNIAIIGAGLSGLALATTLAIRGHKVTIYEQSNQTGGQFNLAKIIPGKEDFSETIRYYNELVELYKIELKLNSNVTDEQLADYDIVAFATGTYPKQINIPGVNLPIVVNYEDVLNNKVKLGNNIAIIGAGGISFDVAIDILENNNNFNQFWGIDTQYKSQGGLIAPIVNKSKFNITICQRSVGKMGHNVGKTTFWIHKATLAKYGVKYLSGINYSKITNEGLYYTKDGNECLLKVDSIIICAGQTTHNILYINSNHPYKYLVGSATDPVKVDAKLAIYQGVKLGLVL